MNKMFALSVIILALGLGACNKKEQAAAPAAAPTVTAPVAAQAIDATAPEVNTTAPVVVDSAAPVAAK